MADLKFPTSPRSFFGNLPASDSGMYYTYSWIHHQLQLDAASEAYEPVYVAIRDATMALGVLLHEPLCFEQLGFQIGPVNDNFHRHILMTVQGQPKAFNHAEIVVKVNRDTGELTGCACVKITCNTK